MVATTSPASKSGIGAGRVGDAVGDDLGSRDGEAAGPSDGEAAGGDVGVSTGGRVHDASVNARSSPNGPRSFPTRSG